MQITETQKAGDATASVLFIEDDPSVQGMLKKLLTRNGYRVTVCDNADMARQRLSGENFNVILSDIVLPGNENFEFISEIGAQPELPPIILITAYPSPNTLNASQRLLIFSYLAKPFENELLLDRLRQAVVFNSITENVRASKTRLTDWINQLEDLESLLKSPFRSDAAVPIEYFIDLTLQNILHPLNDLREMVKRVALIPQEQQHACKLFSCPRLELQLKALRETTQVLSNTKKAFKSKELGELRKKLEGILNTLD